MTRALVTQLVEALEKLSDTEQTYAALDKADAAITAAREYLATEPSGERADSAQWLREFADMEFSYYSREATQLRKAADMLEADVSLINEGNKAQQAKRVPMDEPEDLYALALKADNWGQP